MPLGVCAAPEPKKLPPGLCRKSKLAHLLGEKTGRDRIGEWMALAMNKNLSVSTESKTVRSAFRSAMSNRMDQKIAEGRWSSVQSGKFAISPAADGKKFHVNFLSDSDWITETFLIYPKLLVEAVLTNVMGDEHTRKNLKPISMAHASPAMFWNIVKMGSCDPSDVSSTISRLLHGLVGSAELNRRDRPLSEKALENERQKAEKEKNGKVKKIPLPEAEKE